MFSTLLFFPSQYFNDIKKNLHRELSELKVFNWTISEAYSLPIGLRKQHIIWIKERLQREADEIKKAQRKR